MDSPGDRGDTPQRQQRHNGPGQVQQLKVMLEEKRQEMLQDREHYQPLVHEQIQRQFREFTPRLYVRLRGVDSDQILGLAETSIASLAASNHRALTDTETRALTEHFIRGTNSLMIWKWAMTLSSFYLCFRARHHLRLPFFNPKFFERLDPRTTKPSTRLVVRVGQFACYYGALWLLVDPFFQLFNFLRYKRSMEADPRLANMLTRERQEREEDARERFPPFSNEPSTISERASPAWRPRRQPPQQDSSQQTDSWDAVSPDFDDASPKAASSEEESANRAGGSAWDRIRQQSKNPRWHQEEQGADAASATDEWAKADDDSSPQHRGPKESFSFSRSDEDKAVARSQAQREFDELLEKERKGVDWK